MTNQSDDTSGKAPTNVRSLHGGEASNADKQQFLDYVALRYDEFVRDNKGEKPAFMLFNFVGDKATSVTHYLCPGENETRIALLAARAGFIINVDLAAWENGDD